MAITGLNNKNGFTLIEVMLSLTIIAVALIPLSNLFLQSKYVSVSSLHTIQAVTMAQSILERIKAENYHQVTSGNWQQFTEASCKGNWYYKLIVQDKEHNLKEVTVVLRYPEAGTQKELSLTMIKAKR